MFSADTTLIKLSRNLTRTLYPEDQLLLIYRLTEAGVDVTFHEYSGQIHAFLCLTKVIPDGMRATREIADYVRRQFAI